MDELFNILSSSARIDKSKKKKQDPSLSHSNVCPYHKLGNNSEGDGTLARLGDKDIPSRDRKQKRDTTPTKLEQVRREEVAAFRRSLSIRLSDQNRRAGNVPNPVSSFSEITSPAWWTSAALSISSRSTGGSGGVSEFHAIKSALLHNVERGKWTEPTPIQMQAIPVILERRDILGCAPTGSGKSGAFVLPALFLASCPTNVFYAAIKKDSGGGRDGDDMVEEINAKKKKNRKKDKKNDGGQKLAGNEGGIRSLLLAPSRELAAQLHREVERLGTGKIHGLKSVLLSKANASNVISGGAGGKKGLDVLVSTPLRLVECIKQGLNLGGVRFVVLDEADRLLDAADGGSIALARGGNNQRNFEVSNISGKSGNTDEENNRYDSRKGNRSGGTKQIELDRQSGSDHTQTFFAQIDSILEALPAGATRALFSATVTPMVRSLSESMLRNPVDVTIGNPGSGPSANTDIDQSLVFVGREEGKLLAIRQIIQRGIKPPVIIFLQSKERAQALFRELMYDRINVDVIHAGRSQAARDRVVAKFRKGDTWVLICTDLVARGIDFKGVNMVINYDLPDSGVSYVHRIGRTGRAGRKGTAVTLFTENDFENLRTIANVMKLSGCDVPEWMLTLKEKGSHDGKGVRKGKSSRPPKRAPIDTTPGYDRAKRARKMQAIKSSTKRKKETEEGNNKEKSNSNSKSKI